MEPDELQQSFFAYASVPPLRAETMRQVVVGLNERGAKVEGWESLAIDGRVLIETITERIDASSALIAEISTMNSNVLFELGYAVALNKPTWLAFDETDQHAAECWERVGLFSTVGRTDYGGNAEVLMARFLKNPPLKTPPLAETLLAGAQPREANAIFAASLPVKITAAANLERFLERQTHLKILGSSEDLMIAPLDFYSKAIYRSSAVILHLLGSHRRKAVEHNARASFLAGFAHGLGLPMLMVVEKGFVTPLDYKDLMFEYDTSVELQEKVANWLKNLPKISGSQRRLGRLELDVELPIRSFGQYVAEYEADELENYFVQTSEFTAILEGESQIFAGRKGTGKTATMSQVAEELRRDRKVLVVPIKPSAYEISGLIDVLRRFDGPVNAEYFLMTAWVYLIQCEIALRAISHSKTRPLTLTEEGAVSDLSALLARMEIDEGGTLSSRLDHVVGKVLSQISETGEVDHLSVAKVLRADQIARLRDLTGKLTLHYSRLAILVDNLDKNWQRGADFEPLARLILALLVASGRIEKDFGATRGKSEALVATLAVFLRTDIFDAVRVYAREPDKIGFRTVDWDDEQLLVRVLEERYLANRTGKAGDVMWDELFTREVRGLTTRDYFLWRTLRRPRDFIYFASRALTTAINRRHTMIDSSDVIHAEKEYSRFAIDALIVESESTTHDLEELLYEFAGYNATITDEDLDELLGESSDPVGLRRWLTAASFLGIEVAEDKFEYVEGEVAARRKTKVALRNSKNDRRPVRHRVHPAFRPYLEILDDDLHE